MLLIGRRRVFADDPKVRETGRSPLLKPATTQKAIAELQTLIDTIGPTPERFGLLGGRYKRQVDLATALPAERRKYLNQAIESYEQGMELDLNEYYCSSNLPRLYRKSAGGRATRIAPKTS